MKDSIYFRSGSIGVIIIGVSAAFFMMVGYDNNPTQLDTLHVNSDIGTIRESESAGSGHESSDITFSSHSSPGELTAIKAVPHNTLHDKSSLVFGSRKIETNIDKHKLGMPGSEAVALMQDLYYKLDDEKASQVERLELLKKMELAIRAGLVNSVEYDEALRFVASGNYWSGDIDHALDLGRELMENATDEAIAVSSAQLVGMIEGFDHNNPGASVEAYQRSLEMIEASESWDSHQMQARYVEALGKIAYGYERSGDLERSVDYRKRVLAVNSIGARAWLTGQRQIHEEKLARALAHLGQHDEASVWYDHLLRNYPNLGRDDGSIVLIIRDQINALGLAELSQERLDRLWALFNDESMAQYHQIVAIGNLIAQIYVRRNDSENIERAWGVLWFKCKNLLNNQTLMADSFARDHVISNATTALFSLGLTQVGNGNKTAAIESWQEFMDYFPNHGLADSVQSYLDLYLSIPGQ